MTSKTLSPRALSVIDQYLHFRLDPTASGGGQAVCSVPYFNNKVIRARAALRTAIGKGSPKEIADEAMAVIIKERVSPDSLSDESLKKLLYDNNLGIDCSAFAFYVLAAENEERGKGALKKRLHFANANDLVGRIRCFLRPVENCDVATLALDANSRIVSVGDIKPADMITMRDDREEKERDHILVIHKVDYEGQVPVKVHFSHAAAYPEDGTYGSGIKQGTIDIPIGCSSLLDAGWSENGRNGENKRIFDRARKSRTEIRRFEWL